VIRADTLSELFDVAKLLDAQPVPGGGLVGIVTNAGGLGIMCADACDASGLGVPPLPDAQLRLATMVDEHAEIAEADMNPVIVSADGALVVDARVRVEQPPPRRPWPAVGA